MAESIHLLVARRKRRLTQAQLAELAVVSVPTLYRLERGLGGLPKVETLQRLATALETTPEALFPELLGASRTSAA